MGLIKKSRARKENSVIVCQPRIKNLDTSRILNYNNEHQKLQNLERVGN